MQMIIFDIDGTLTDTKEVDNKCFIQAFEKVFGVDIKNEKWSLLQNVTDWGITEEIINRELSRDPSQKEYDDLIQVLTKLLKQTKDKNSSLFTEVPGASRFVNHLRTNTNVPIGIATGAWEESAKVKMSCTDIDLNQLTFSNSNHHKSREDITLRTIRQLKEKHGHDGQSIVYFGDGAWDYKTCSNLNIHFVGIDILLDGELRNLGAQTVFQDFSNQEKILNHLKTVS